MRRKRLRLTQTGLLLAAVVFLAECTGMRWRWFL